MNMKIASYNPTTLITAIAAFALALTLTLTLASCSEPASDAELNPTPSNSEAQEATTDNASSAIEPNPGAEETLMAVGTEVNPVVAALALQGIERDKHYTVVKNPFDDAENMLSVTEFFWYGCSHCMHAEPLVQQWKTQLPANSTITKSPAIWNALMELHAKIYFIAEDEAKESVKNELHASLFNKIIQLREDKVGLIDQKSTLRSHLANFGVDTNRFDELFDSGNMQNKIDRAKATQRQANISGTPAFVVGGTYYLNLQSINEELSLFDLGNTVIKAMQRNTR